MNKYNPSVNRISRMTEWYSIKPWEDSSKFRTVNSIHSRIAGRLRNNRPQENTEVSAEVTIEDNSALGILMEELQCLKRGLEHPYFEK